MGRSVTYPDGSTLVSSAYTPAPNGGTIGAFLHPILMGMIGAAYDVNSSLVRFSWPTAGAPFQDINDDIMYVSCLVRDENYDKIRELIEGPESGPILETWHYTRVWTIRLVSYGPNSYDNLRAAASAIYQPYFTEQFALGQLFPVPEFAPPVRAPEQFNAQWWERADFRFDLYEWVTEMIERNTISSAEVIVITPDMMGGNTIVADINLVAEAVLDGGAFDGSGGIGPDTDGGAFNGTGGVGPPANGGMF